MGTCLSVLEDIIFMGHTFEAAFHNLDLVIERFTDANVTLKPIKCVFFQIGVVSMA